MSTSRIFLGIESSCDDTAAAVLRERPDGGADILSSVVHGQTDLHAQFGGVVPEIAARAHAEKLDSTVSAALEMSGQALSDIDAVSVTAGPGLIGGVVSGVMTAKAIAASTGKPLYAVNHLAGHALTPRLVEDVPFPYLMLLVSGGHCQFLLVSGPDSFTRLGSTIDDAPGEAFDKVARLIGLPQPGGPNVECRALDGDANRFAFPRPLSGKPGCDMSFSGLKTAVLRARDGLIEMQGGLYKQDQNDLSASFQAAVTDVLTLKSRRAIAACVENDARIGHFCVAGGVAANSQIRKSLLQLCGESGLQFVAPPLDLCTDNAAMIAFAAIEQSRDRTPDGMEFVARPRWPLDKLRPSQFGHGKKGPKV